MFTLRLLIKNQANFGIFSYLRGLTYIDEFVTYRLEKFTISALYSTTV